MSSPNAASAAEPDHWSYRVAVHYFIAWCGFIGAWLLVAGPVYQAAMELDEYDIKREQYRDWRFPPERRVSRWWWLVPPVAYWLRRQEHDRLRREFMHALTPEQRATLVSFINKATGWLLVGFGALGIATKETWELCEPYDWPPVVFWLLVPIMTAICLGYTVGRVRRTHHVDRKSVV